MVRGHFGKTTENNQSLPYEEVVRGQNPSRQNPNQTKRQQTKPQSLILDVGVQTFLMFTIIHACMVRCHGSCLPTYYHHAQLLDAPYTNMYVTLLCLCCFGSFASHLNTNSNNLLTKWNCYTFELTLARQY